MLIENLTLLNYLNKTSLKQKVGDIRYSWPWSVYVITDGIQRLVYFRCEHVNVLYKVRVEAAEVKHAWSTLAIVQRCTI